MRLARSIWQRHAVHIELQLKRNQQAVCVGGGGTTQHINQSPAGYQSVWRHRAELADG